MLQYGANAVCFSSVVMPRITKLNVIMLSAFVHGAIMLTVVVQSVIMLWLIILSTVMMIFIMLRLIILVIVSMSVVVLWTFAECHYAEGHFAVSL